MLVREAILGRQSIGKVKPEPVERSLIEQLLEAAVRAPNHYGTEPWRFFVMEGDGRKKLGKAYADVAAAEMAARGEPLRENVIRMQEEKAYRAPVVIAVAACPADLPKVNRVEELAATHAAVQNMLLTAHALGLGAIWRSGAPAYHPIMKAAFDLGESDSIVGFVYVGYPAVEPKRSVKASYSEKTVWITEDKTDFAN